ncbi:AraC family transcriptional regulator [Rothia halotolerans]|uniref:AraC family transcriptional regulator n=1 Tax=Rothia halotolerans TaxID=405770 RepID=UPI00101D68B6|nr:AraC family transcriptional regulator [Rothia halotolerans]
MAVPVHEGPVPAGAGPARTGSDPAGAGRFGAAERELVPLDSASGLRWFQHDYPHPLGRWHHHPEIEIHLITASTGTAHIGTAVRVFEPGSLYLVGSGLPHHWVSPLPPDETVRGRDMLLQIDPMLPERLAALLPALGVLDGLLADAAHGVEFTGATRERAARVLASMRGTTGMERFAAALTLLSVLVAAPREEREIIDPHHAARALPRDESETFDRALRYVYEHLAGPLRLGDVAEHLTMSRSGVSRLFTRATSVGFSRTVTRLRVTEACRLLRTTDLPVAEVCWAAGFANLSNFNRRFREETGSTPREYRRTRGG